MPVNQQQRRNKRIEKSEEKAKLILEQVRKHDLYPLASFLGIEADLLSQAKFTNLFSTDKDFKGSDFLMYITELLRWYLQDKLRETGKDLCLEFCRMYRLDDTLIMDGGRDLWRLFGPVEYQEDERTGLNMVVRDWDNTKTESDLFLFHPKGDPDYYWIKSDSAKAIAFDLYDMWIDRFHLVYDLVKENCFRRGGQVMLNSHMDSATMDIYCKQDPDSKFVMTPDGQKTFSTCKAVVFIPLEELPGQWAKTKLRKP